MFSGLSSLDITIILVVLIASVVLHEFMHGFVAFKLGDTTAADHGRLTLNPLKSVDVLFTIVIPFVLLVTRGIFFFAAKPVPFNPDRVKWDEYGAALVGLAGPATNFVLAVLGAGLYHVAGPIGVMHTTAYYITAINIGMMVFNLIPFPPLDGSRVLYAFAPEPVQRVMAQIEAFGFTAILVFIFVLYQFIAPIVTSVQQSILLFLLGGTL